MVGLSHPCGQVTESIERCIIFLKGLLPRLLCFGFLLCFHGLWFLWFKTSKSPIFFFAFNWIQKRGFKMKWQSWSTYSGFDLLIKNINVFCRYGSQGGLVILKTFTFSKTSLNYIVLEHGGHPKYALLLNLTVYFKLIHSLTNLRTNV